MKHLPIKLLVLAVALLAPALAWAAGTTYTHKASHVSFVIPDDWKVEAEDDELTASAPNDGLHLFVHLVGDAKELKEALDGLDEEMDEVLDDIHVAGDVEEGKANDLPAAYVHGTAKYKGSNILWLAAVIDAGDHVVVVSVFGSEEGVKKHADAAKAIFQSAKVGK
jgi:predicted Zn-dependent protease